MLRRFFGRSRIPLIPARWLNAVANVLNNIRSPKGTVKASLEGDGEGSHLRIDIVPRAAAREMRAELSADFLLKGDSSLLGDGLIWRERGLTIDKDWLMREVIQGDKA